MAVDRALFGLCAWLLTYALHSTVLIAAAWIASASLTRLASGRTWILSVRERLWRLALLGALLTATLHAFGFGPWSTHVVLATPTAGAAQIQMGAAAGSSQRSAPPITDTRGTPAGVPQAWIRGAAAAWATGVAWALVAWWADWKRLRRRIRGLALVHNGAAFDRLESLRARGSVRRRVRLARAPELTSPITVGILRPTICLPPRAERDLAPDELEALLAHELAHAVRRDPTWLAIGRTIGALLFVQPLNRIARAHLAEDAELLCDDWAVRHTGDPLPLASCLTEIATWLVGEGGETLAPAMAARGSRLSRRVRRLLDETRSEEDGATRRPLGLSASLALIALPLCVPGVRAQDDSSAPIDPLAPVAASGRAFAGLAQDLDALEIELDALRAEIDAQPASSALRTRFEGLETRMRALRSMSAELEALFKLTKDSPLEREGQHR